jgi:hypothetical protein
LHSQTEVAINLLQKSATFVAIGPNADQLISELKHQIFKFIDKPIEKLLFTKQNEPIWYSYFFNIDNMETLNI